MKKLSIILVSLIFSLTTFAATSVAGLFPISDQGREVWNMSPDWRFLLGDVDGAERTDFDDSAWDVVAVPHCVKLEPAEASGCRNYQGIAWYRKHFTVPADRSTLYFEAIMGKQRIFVNGKLASEHLGGYLPVIVDLHALGLHKGDKCVVAVETDNSNDKTYPPGKPQYTLDFAYHGGIYRDVWLIANQEVSITNPLKENRRDAGIFVHFENISDKTATVLADVDVKNDGKAAQTVTIEQTLVDPTGKTIKTQRQRITLAAGQHSSVTLTYAVKKPQLWSPETPYLYQLVTRIKDGKRTLDGGMTRLGIRSFEFRGKEGFWLNGKKYKQFIGANRHQDFAYVGNAMPNSQQWRDVLRLKNASFNIIRTAHYPQDPSFMDACDELGIFIIVATPGWQYWNKDPQFADRVFQNTREIIRRDRNHPSVLMWEPILNETRYPKDFALKSLQLTRDEYPYPYRPVAVADWNSAGVKENYDVVYGWPDMDMSDIKQCVFTREFGEYVDDWYAHNNLNRASRSWGERPQLMQALSLAKTTAEMHTPGQFIGGCQWHPFDHQRGYHPDPYWGGIYDAFRQKKTAFHMFASQIPADSIKGTPSVVNQGPMVYVAHEMTQFSDPHVIVFSNCDSVRLTVFDGEKVIVKSEKSIAGNDKLFKLDSALIANNPSIEEALRSSLSTFTFKDVWDFWQAREYSYKKKSPQKVSLLAEGFKDGKVVCSHKRMPSRRSTKLRLYVDEMSKKLVADGTDFVVVVAEVTDDNGNVRRLAKENVRFTIEGEGTIIGDGEGINANPRAVEWGSAPILVRSTRQAGKIRIHAEVEFPGTHAPAAADLEIESIPYDGKMLEGEGSKVGGPRFKVQGSRLEVQGSRSKVGGSTTQHPDGTLDMKSLLREVELQQADFGVTK